MERFAWAEHLSPEAIFNFRDWVRKEGGRFLERADAYLGENELPRRSWTSENERFVGVGLYYFEDERE